MLALVLWLLITPSPGIAGIELNVSDPQATNLALIQQCISYTGSCNVWYVPGSYHIFEPVHIPFGVRNVYLTGVTVVPCAQMGSAFVVDAPLGAPLPHFHDLTIDQTQACGTFTPPLMKEILWP